MLSNMPGAGRLQPFSKLRIIVIASLVFALANVALAFWRRRLVKNTLLK
jgi:hypothetical protein